MTVHLARLATGRNSSLFTADLATSDAAIRDSVSGSRLLVIGGAGSIGGATVRALLRYAPAALDVVDQSENALAELVRDVRSDDLVRPATTLRLLPLDYGAPVTARVIRDEAPYDAVLHFAALKHVRSGKDAASVLQMLDTNVIKQRRFMGWLADRGAPARYFAVSTDKAANPVNHMGASKRLMEHLLFTHGVSGLSPDHATSARFANVAFSAGSLLASWRERMDRRQPIAVPRDTYRYFVSLDEAAAICLLAAFALPGRALAIPRMTANSDLHELAPIAAAFARAAGYEPEWHESEADARAAIGTSVPAGRWPVLLTPLDTEGEKESEEFVGAGEAAAEAGWKELRAVPQRGADPAALAAALDQLEAWVARPDLAVSRRDIAQVVASVVPEFAPVANVRSLDERM